MIAPPPIPSHKDRFIDYKLKEWWLERFGTMTQRREFAEITASDIDFVWQIRDVEQAQRNACRILSYNCKKKLGLWF